MTEKSPTALSGKAETSEAPMWPTDALHVVGSGPGDPRYLTAIGRDLIREADVVFGFDSVLEYVESHVPGTALACRYATESELLGEFAA